MKAKPKQSPQFVIYCANDPAYKGMTVWLGNRNPKTGAKFYWVDDIRQARRFYQEEKALAICSVLDAPKGHLEPSVIRYVPPKQTTPSDRQLARKMREIGESEDVEGNHVLADRLLCEVLESLGYPKLVEAFNDLEKWYG